MKTVLRKALFVVLPVLTLFVALQGTAQTCPTLNVNASSITPANCGSSNGSIRLGTPTGGTAPYTLTWNTTPPRTGANLLLVPAGTYTVTIKDARGCTTAKQFTVPQAPDATAPIILCDGGMTVDNDPGLCGVYLQPQDNTPVDFRMGATQFKGDAIALSLSGRNARSAAARVLPLSNRIIYRPTVSDNCGVVTLGASRSDGLRVFADPYPVGTTTITWKATDGSNNVSTCTQEIIVIDDEAPVINLPSDLNLTTVINGCGANVTWTEPTASDNCGVQSLTLITSGVTNGGFFTSGTHTITYEAVDIHGNHTQSSFTITVADRQVPTIISCPAPISTVAANGCSAVVTLTPPTASDNCTPNQQLSITNNAPALFPVGITTVTWTVTDASGNSTTCTQTVTVLDQTNPTPVLPTLPDVIGDCSVTVTSPTAVDCGRLLMATTTDPLTYTQLGNYTIHWTYTDSSGNFTQQTQNVVVRDLVPPTISCPKDITVMANQSCGRFVDPGVAQGSDNCSVTVTGQRSDNRPLTDCYPIGTTTITWTATDGAGQTATCTQRVIVNGLSISGTVYDDADAGVINGSPVTNDMGYYVNLVDVATHTVVASKQLDNGAFRFDGNDGLLPGVSTYQLVLTTSATSTSPALHDGIEWVNTAEGTSGTAGDGVANGIFEFGMPVVDGQVIDFGIEARPKPAVQFAGMPFPNPGGTNTFVFDANLFNADDVRDLNSAGEVRYLHILDFPDATTSVTFASAATSLHGTYGTVTYTAANFPAGGVYVACTPTGQPTAPINVDPVNGPVTVEFRYKAIDQADVESNSTGLADQPLDEFYFNVTVVNDVDALTNGLVDGFQIPGGIGSNLYINLVDRATNTVVASKPWDINVRFGTADGLSSTVTTYSVVLTTSPQATSPALPESNYWWNTGEAMGDVNSPSAVADGTVDGIYNFNSAIGNMSYVLLGIEARPKPVDLLVATAQPNPGGTNLVTIDPGTFRAYDDRDNQGGQVRYLHLLSFPTNSNAVTFASAATSLHGTYGSVTYTAASFPAGGIYVACDLEGNPTNAISVDPVDGAVNIDFVYKAIDQADAEGPETGIARQPLTDIAISGTVYNDANGGTDGLINGTPVSNAGGQLYINLVNTATNSVVASKTLTGGTFRFTTADGLQAGVSTYQLVLSNSATATTALLPDAATWVNTGEGTSGTAGDASVDGSFTFGAAVVDGQAIDFGIEARPVPATLLVGTPQVNPGGTATVAIAPTLFAATDATDLNNTGVVKYIWITTFPTNTNTVNFAGASTTLGGSNSSLSFTAASFPAGGVYVAANTSGNPTTAISVDPVDGSVNVDFAYKAIDQANVISNNTGIARQPLTDLSISGKVYNDANALTDGLINGALISNAGGQLYVNLVNTANNTVVSSKAVSNGSFSFTTADGLQATVATYKLVLTASATAANALLPDASAWINTGEGASGTSGDGTVNGCFTFGAAVVNGQAIDFGIEARPIPGTLLVGTPQVNPGGSNTVTIAPTLFTGTDATDLNNSGMVKYIHILSFPTNATTVNFTAAATSVNGTYGSVSYTAATFPANGVYVATNASGNPTAAITVDPVDGAVNVDFTYKAVDQAFAESNNSGIARQPLTELSISGHVYDDVNALTDAQINGTLISNAGGPLYVNLVNTATNMVVASKAVTNGGFSFGTADGLQAGVTTYQLVLAASSTATTPALPNASAWINTGEGNSGSAGDGAIDGSFAFGAAVTNGQVIDFGIEARPVPATLNVAPTQVNPGGTNTVSIAATLFAATDATDITGGEVRYIHIVSFPTNTTTVTFASATTTPGGAATNVTYTAGNFPAGGVYVATNTGGNPTSAISVDPVDGSVNVDFTYKAVDQANAESNTTGIARQPLQQLVISGKVYDDANALTDGLINGTLISNAGGQLYVNLVNTASNTLVSSKAVTNGTFTFNTTDGLIPGVTTYKLVLAASATATTPSLPNTSVWLNTGEGTTGTSGDGTVDGSFTFGAAVVDGQAIDFGIEARPVPNALSTAPSQVNPGGTNTVTIAATLFSANDATDLNNTGLVKYIHIVSFPTNTTTVNFASAATSVNGTYTTVSYTAANFPAGGVYLATNATGNPTSSITVDPVDGAVTVDFTYKAVDQALVESTGTGIARQPLTDLAISGTVYDDANGTTDALINGTPVSNAGGQLYVNLVRGNTVVASKALTDGTFRFTTADGLSASVTNYKLVLTNSASGSSALLPDATNWVNTAEGNSGTSGDGTVDGSFTFGSAVTNGQAIDFGIEARPVPTTLLVAPSQVNPGGTTVVTIAPTLFAATDATDLNNTGVVKYIWITSFPTNTTTVNFAGAATTLGGTPTALSYTAASFPAGGVYIATNAAGNPATAITVDPVDGSVNVDFTYKAIDQAKVVSNNSGIARQPLTCPAPTMTCPSTLTVASTPNKCGANVSLTTPTASSQCGIASVTGVRSDNLALTALFPVGTTTVTWTATAGDGATVTCTQTVKVNDTQLPAISCGAAISVNNDPGQCGAFVTCTAPTASDNCSVTSVAGVRNDGRALTALFPIGTTTITWTATDASGNTATCTQNVIVTDNTKPTITCGIALTAVNTPGSCGATITVPQPTASDNCSVTSITGVRSDNLALTAVYPKGVTTITWTATDASGNIATCTQTVTVTDNEKPVMTCPAAISVNNTTGQCGATVSVTTPTATDNCGSVTVTGVRSDGLALTAQYPIGATTITWTAADASGNKTVCTQTVTVTDRENPVITCGAAIVKSNDAGACSATFTPAAPTATDNCAGVTVAGVRSDGLALNAAYPKGLTTITWTATDASGNKASCTQTVTVNDTEKPTLTTPGPITACDNGSGNNKTLTASAADNCGSVTVTYSLTGATTGTGTGVGVTSNFNVGVTTVTWTAKDATGNTLTGSTTVTINAIPTASITVSANDTLCLNTVLTGSGGATYQWLNGGSVVGTGQTLSLPLANCTGTIPFAPTAAAKNFNVFVSGAVTATGGDTHGPVAMGGDLYLNGQTIFTMNTSGTYPSGNLNDANNYGMVIGGRVQYTTGNQSTVNQGYLRIANATGSQLWYVDNNNNPTNLKLTATGAGFNGNPSLTLQRVQATGTATQASGLDFTSAFSSLNTESNRISSWSSSNASFLNKITIGSGSNPHVTLADNKINYIDLTVTQLNNLINQGSIIFDNKPTATRTLVINVLSSGTINWTPANIGGISEADGAYILWNFNGSCTLNLNGSNAVYGTLLAPGASITKSNGNNLNGQIIAQALRVGSGEIHYYPFASSLGYPGCSNTFQLYVTNSAGCTSTVPATYTYQAPVNTEKYTILGLDAVTLADNNYVQSGGVGVNNAGGTATVQGTSTISGGGTFLKAPVQSIANTATVTTRYTAQAGYTLPAMQYYSAGYTNLVNYNVGQGQTVTLSSNYADVYVAKNATVTLTGTTFKSVTIEEGATVNFTNTTVNMTTLLVGNNNNTGIARANFVANAQVRISGSMTIGKKSIVNGANNRVYFYLGTDAVTDKVVAKGGGSILNGIVLAPTGNIKVGTDAQNPTVTAATATNCTQTDGCIIITYNGWTKNYDGTYTYKYTVTNKCQNGISHCAFELKNNSTALSWTAGNGSYAWGITNGTNNPYSCIKFEHPSPSLADGGSDVLSYTVSASDFNSLTTIRATVKFGNNETTYTFNRDGCSTTIMPPPCTNSYMTGIFVGKTVTGDKCTYWNSLCGGSTSRMVTPTYVRTDVPVPSESRMVTTEEAAAAKVVPAVKAFPNPSNGSFNLQLRGLAAGAVQVQVLNASGAVVAARQFTYGGKEEVLSVQLGAVPGGLYTVRVTGRDGALSTRILIAR